MVSQESIIEVIQRMVQEGQPRERILTTLSDLGVNEEQAKRLLLIAEADTFTILKKEIGSLVRTELASQRSEFEGMIKKDIHAIEEEEKLKVAEIAGSQLKDVREDIVSESKEFSERVNKVISDSQKSVSLVKVALDSLGARIAQMEIDVEQLKVHRYRRHSMVMSYALASIGAAVLMFAAFLLFTNFAMIDLSQMIIITVLCLVSITLIFGAILA